MTVACPSGHLVAAFPVLATLIVCVLVVLFGVVDEDVAVSIISRQQSTRGDNVTNDANSTSPFLIRDRNGDGDSPCYSALAFGSPVPPSFSHITKRQCRRRALTNQGNEASFFTVASRLSRGLPINVVVFGGSVCLGHPIRKVGAEHSFAAKLGEFLRKVFPPTGTGTVNNRTKASGADAQGASNANNEHSHSVTIYCVGATGTNQAWESARAKDHARTIRNAHLFLVDKGSNDIEDKELTGSWQRPGHSRGSDSIRFWTEALIRELRSSAPRAGLIWVETAWRKWRDRECNGVTLRGREMKRGGCHAPFHTDASHTHLEVLEYYDVAQISMLRLLGPFGNEEKRKWLERSYFVDGYHPNREGHKMIASVIGLMLTDLVDRLNNEDEILGGGGGGEPSLADTNAAPLLLGNVTNTAPITIPPLTLTPQDLDFLASDPVVNLDLSDERTARKSLVVPGGWRYGTDRPGKPKTLMIERQGNNATASSSAGGGSATGKGGAGNEKKDDDEGDDDCCCAVLYLGCPQEQITALGLNLLFSYEGFGVAHVELLEEEEADEVAAAAPINNATRSARGGRRLLNLQSGKVNGKTMKLRLQTAASKTTGTGSGGLNVAGSLIERQTDPPASRRPSSVNNAPSPLDKTHSPLLSTDINCQWASRTSQVSFEKVALDDPKVMTQQRQRQKPGTKKFLKVCLDPSSPSGARKLKLFSVMLY